MNCIEGRFNGVRNIAIHYRGWLPEGEVKAVLLIVHGLGEHCARYTNVVDHLVPQGYAVYGFDHIGHGRSEGRREVIARFRDFTDTLAIYYGMVNSWQAEKPLFLLGHSMGGLIASHYLLDHSADFQGAVISAPLVKIGDDISPMTIVLGHILSALAPRMGILQVDAHAVSRDPAVVQAYVNDPLVFHRKTPARLAAELPKAMRRVMNEAHMITLPMLVLQGSEDKLVDPGGAQMLFDRAGTRDKQIKIYEGLYHEVFNEPEHTQVLEDMAIWLAAHI